MSTSASLGASVAAAADEVIERIDRYITLLEAVSARDDSEVVPDLDLMIAFAVAQLRDMAPTWQALRADGHMLQEAFDAGQAALLAQQAVARRRHLGAVANG